MLDAFLGNATMADAKKIQSQHADALLPDETVEAAFKFTRDSFIFTDKRLIIIDIQGVTGKKVEYLIIPYKSIKYYSVETAGHFDRDSEIKIWVSDRSDPTVERQVKKGVDVRSLQKLLAYHIC